MHSDREKLVERLKSYGEPCSFDNYSGTLFRFDSGAKFFLSDEDVSAIAALSEPVKDEPVAWALIFADNYGVNTETTFKRQGLAEEYASRCSAPKPRVVPLYTRPAGERPAVAVEAKHIVELWANECHDISWRQHFDLAMTDLAAALTAEPQAVPEGMVLVSREPTDAMVEAHFRAHAEAETVFAEVADVWRAMLAASPAVQGGE